MPPPCRRLAALTGLFVLAPVVVFARVVRFEFAYDDWWTVVHNPALDWRLGELLRVLVAGKGVDLGVVDATRPAQVVSLWLDRRLWGDWPGGYHLHSLLLYGLTCGSAMLALFALTRSVRAAVIGAVFFMITPLHAEVVAAVNYREDLLAALGVLGPLAWLWWPRRRPQRPPAQVGIAALWALGLLAKESAVALLPIILAAGVITRRGWSWARRVEGTLLALTAAFIIWANWRAALFLAGDDIPRAPWTGWGATVASTMRFEVRAVSKVLFPFWWSPEYADPAPAGWGWAAALALLVGGIVQLSKRRKTRVAALGLAIAALAPLPTSPLAAPVNEWADRYLFVASFGGALVWGGLADHAIRRFGRWGYPVPVVVGAALLGLSQQAVAAWQDDFTLWSVAVERAPDSARSWTGLSRARRLAGDAAGAGEAVDQALQLEPDFVPAHVTRVYTLLAAGRMRAARRQIQALYRAGHGSARGLSRAERCARMGRERAKDCINR